MRKKLGKAHSPRIILKYQISSKVFSATYQRAKTSKVSIFFQYLKNKSLINFREVFIFEKYIFEFLVNFVVSQLKVSNVQEG